MTRKNSEIPYRSEEDKVADEILQRMPSAFPPTPLDEQEKYVERMIRRDQESERRKVYE